MTNKRKMLNNLTVKTLSKVRFSEVDSLGIVWHGHYIAYFEDGREDFGKKHGISYLDVQRHGFVTPIVKSSCEHLLPLKYGENFRIETTFVPSSAAKMIFRYEIFNEENKLVCKGETVQVFLNMERELQLISPDFYLEWQRKTGIIN